MKNRHKNKYAHLKNPKPPRDKWMERYTLKDLAHRAFDPLWQGGYMSRGEAYRWLAKALHTHPTLTHMSQLKPQQLRLVPEYCAIKLMFLKDEKKNAMDRTSAGKHAGPGEISVVA